MSIRVMDKVWQAKRLEPHELLVMLVLADHASDDGTDAWPSVETIAAKVRRTPRSVQRTLAELRDKGYIEVEWNRGGNDRVPNDRRPNRYTIRLEKLSDGVTPTSPRQVDGVTPMTPRGDVGDVHGVTPTSPKPSLNRPEPSSDEPGWNPPPEDVRATVRSLFGATG